MAVVAVVDGTPPPGLVLQQGSVQTGEATTGGEESEAGAAATFAGGSGASPPSLCTAAGSDRWWVSFSALPGLSLLATVLAILLALTMESAVLLKNVGEEAKGTSKTGWNLQNAGSMRHRMGPQLFG